MRVATSSNVRTELGGGPASSGGPVKESYRQDNQFQQGGQVQGLGRAGTNLQKESEMARGAVRNLLEVVLMEEFKEAYGEPLWRQVATFCYLLKFLLLICRW